MNFCSHSYPCFFCLQIHGLQIEADDLRVQLLSRASLLKEWEKKHESLKRQAAEIAHMEVGLRQKDSLVNFVVVVGCAPFSKSEQGEGGYRLFSVFSP